MRIASSRLQTILVISSIIIKVGDALLSHEIKKSLSVREPVTTRNSIVFPALQLGLDSSELQDKYDLVVVGAGVVGVNAALSAAQAPHSKKVLLVDAPRASGALMNEATGDDLSLGGPTGLFSKALRDTSKRIKVSTLRGMGLREDSIWNEIIQACTDLAYSNAQDIKRQLDLAEVDFFQGFASFPDGGGADNLFITETDGAIFTVKMDKILIATGSQPFRPAGIPFDGKRIFDSDSINSLSYLPKSVAITGSGIIAVEFAKIFSNLGAEVTMIIRDLVPRTALTKIGLDKDVAAVLVADLIRSGVKFLRGVEVSTFDVPKTSASPIKITLEAKAGGYMPKGQSTLVTCDAYLAAVGRKPNTGNLNLAAAGIKVDEYGGILVNSKLSSSAKNVYAAGDVLGRPFLASTGMVQAKSAIASMFDRNTATRQDTDSSEEGDSPCDPAKGDSPCDPASLSANPFAFPAGIWSNPEAAYFGLSSQQAEEMGIEVGEAVSLYAECLRGRVFNPDGLLKLVYEKPAGRILGVHICGDDACELIHYGMELVKSQRTILELSTSMYAAVTYHEMYRIAAQAALDGPGARKRRAAAGAALAKRNRGLRSKK